MFGRRRGASRSTKMLQYCQALMRLSQGDSKRDDAHSKLMGRSTLGGRTLLEHFPDERLDELGVDKWNLGVDQPPFTFEFR